LGTKQAVNGFVMRNAIKIFIKHGKFFCAWLRSDAGLIVSKCMNTHQFARVLGTRWAQNQGKKHLFFVRFSVYKIIQLVYFTDNAVKMYKNVN
jgi:hypothetical protein